MFPFRFCSILAFSLVKMGKSPGKWIKGILFGRKGSKSNLSTGRELSRSASEKPAQVSSKEPISTSKVDTRLIPGPISRTISDRIEISSFGKGEAAILACEGQMCSLSNKKEEDKPSDIGAPNDPVKITLEEAAIIVQAFFRGYQARHGYQSLKGVVQLQTAVRGHLVRRQAVATLFCMQGIVKFQAITRGYMVRQGSTGNGHCRKQRPPPVKDAINQNSCEINYSRANTLFNNAFIHELLASSRTAMPLQMDCGPGDSNSAWSWLLRWSISQVWVPNVKQNDYDDSKLPTVRTEQIKSKRNGRGVPSVIVRNELNNANAVSERAKLIGRRLSSPSVKSAQENPQIDNDKVKHGVKKNQKPIGEISNEKTDVNKPKVHQRKLSKSLDPKSSVRTSNTPTGKSIEDLAEPEVNCVASQLTGHLSSEEHRKLFSNRSQDILSLGRDFQDDQISSKNYESNQKTPLPIKGDDQDVTRDSVRRIPSYMARTASSKAKTKAQVSPRFGQDETERTALTRRHSLPYSVNGKLISSPRVLKLVQSSGKEGNKIDRSLSSSREIADKVNHVDWKR